MGTLALWSVFARDAAVFGPNDCTRTPPWRNRGAPVARISCKTVRRLGAAVRFGSVRFGRFPVWVRFCVLCLGASWRGCMDGREAVASYIVRRFVLKGANGYDVRRTAGGIVDEIAAKSRNMPMV